MSPSLIMPPSPPSFISNHHAISNAVVADPPMIGTRISGILHKWVNCGKRWKPRWFVLQDGVLSYYKIHGCDNIVVSNETDTICRVSGSHLPNHRKPLGELHLKVSSIHESESDERRFSIFTGTKILHLKANTREDQMEWMEALKAVKQMFPRMSNKELMNSISSVTVSTEKLRTRLLKEGVNEEIVQDAERIMRREFLEMENQLVLVREKLRLLIDKLGKL